MYSYEIVQLLLQYIYYLFYNLPYVQRNVRLGTIEKYMVVWRDTNE